MIVICVGALRHRESMDIHSLKMNNDEEYYDDIVEYKYEIERRPEDTFDHVSLLFEQLHDISSLKSFRLSFAQGNIKNELSTLHIFSRLPRFGSHLQAVCSTDDDFVDLSYVLGSWFSLANERIGQFERFSHKKYSLFWYSYNIEHPCVEHMYKLMKIVPSRGLSTVISSYDNAYHYKSIDIEYKDEPQSNIQHMNITLRIAVPHNSIHLIKTKEFTPLIHYDLEPAEETEKPALVSRVSVYNHYMNKLVQADIVDEGFSRTIKDIMKSEGTTNKMINSVTTTDGGDSTESEHYAIKEKSGLVVQRFIRGKVAAFHNNLIVSVNNTVGGSKMITLYSIFDSHQYGFLSDISITTSMNRSVEYETRYVDRIPKPASNNDIHTILISFMIEPFEQIVVSHPYLINFRMLNEYEQEYERGTYIIGSVLVSHNIENQEFDVHEDKWYTMPDDSVHVHQLPPILTNEKQIDNTFAFTTLSINNICLFILPITIMFIAASIKK